MIQELIKKIELQSILVLFITLGTGAILLKTDNSWTSPAGLLGAISIGFGILYTFGSFFANQIKESYKDVIDEYKSTISVLKSSHKHIQKTYLERAGAPVNKRASGAYQADETDTTTTVATSASEEE